MIRSGIFNGKQKDFFVEGYVMRSTDIGERITELREEHGFSQKELAQQIPISQSTLSRWESGMVIPPLQQLERTCEILGEPLERVFTGNEAEYGRLRKKLSVNRLIIVVLTIVILATFFALMVPKYRILSEGEVYQGAYGNTMRIYAQPIFFITDEGADSYGSKVAKKYSSRDDLMAVEIVFVKSDKEPVDEDNIYFSSLYILKAFTD